MVGEGRSSPTANTSRREELGPPHVLSWAVGEGNGLCDIGVTPDERELPGYVLFFFCSFYRKVAFPLTPLLSSPSVPARPFCSLFARAAAERIHSCLPSQHSSPTAALGFLPVRRHSGLCPSRWPRRMAAVLSLWVVSLCVFLVPTSWLLSFCLLFRLGLILSLLLACCLCE